MSELFVLFVLVISGIGEVNTAAGGYPTMQECQKERMDFVQHVHKQVPGEVVSYIAECIPVVPVVGA